VFSLGCPGNWFYLLRNRVDSALRGYLMLVVRLKLRGFMTHIV
jgi:hypothetical protein